MTSEVSSEEKQIPQQENRVQFWAHTRQQERGISM